jgi:polyhydroxybutyrate depolymerase
MPLVLMLTAARASAASSIEPTIKVADENRTYRLFVPPGLAGKRAPAFIILHGGSSSAPQMETYSAFDEFAQSHGLVAIYPQGVGRHWNDGRVKGAESTADDVAFIVALRDALVSEGVIDPKRVYAAGISNGGFMAFHLACLKPDLLAGIAVVAADQPADAACPSLRPMPVIFFHGTKDKFVPFDGGEFVPEGLRDRGSALSDAATVAIWQKENGCGAARRSELPGKGSGAAMRVTVESYSCPPGRGLQNVIIEGGGHTWPGAHQGDVANMILGPVDDEIDANEMMWRFFQAQAAQP